MILIDGLRLILEVHPETDQRKWRATLENPERGTRLEFDSPHELALHLGRLEREAAPHGGIR